MEPAGRRSPVRSGRGPDLVDYLEHRLLQRLGEPAGDACLHAWHQRRISEGLPALLRVVQGDDGPPVRRRAGRMELLTGGQAPVGWVNRRDRGLVLILRAALELVNNAITHGGASLLGVDPSRARGQPGTVSGGARLTLRVGRRGVDGQTTPPHRTSECPWAPDPGPDRRAGRTVAVAGLHVAIRDERARRPRRLLMPTFTLPGRRNADRFGGKRSRAPGA